MSIVIRSLQVTRPIVTSVPPLKLIQLRSITSRSIRARNDAISRIRNNNSNTDIDNGSPGASATVQPTQPPTYFENTNEPPKTLDELKLGPSGEYSQSAAGYYQEYNNNKNTATGGNNGNSTIGAGASAGTNSNSSKPNTLNSLLIFLFWGAFTYLCILQEQELSKMRKELSSTHMTLNKVLINYKNQTDQLQKKIEQRQKYEKASNEVMRWKLLVHIAILRRELEASGKSIDDISVDQVLEEFQKNIMLNNKQQQTQLWCRDDSELKKYLPNFNDYDKKR